MAVTDLMSYLGQSWHHTCVEAGDLLETPPNGGRYYPSSMIELTTHPDLQGVTMPVMLKAVEAVGKFNDDELEQWKNGVQKGLKEGDWADLVARCTYHPPLYGLFSLIHGCSGTAA